MSDIVLTAAVRQNLLSLQGTAESALDHADPPCHRQEGQQRARQPDQLLHRCRPRCPRQRHQQPARQHRQRRAGSAGRRHRHHLAAKAGRYREVDRQPGVAAALGLQHEVQRPVHRHRRSQRARRSDCLRPHHQQAQRRGFHVHKFRRHCCHDHRRYCAFGFQSGDQDGAGPVTGPIQSGAGGCGSEPLNRDHRH